MVQHELNLDFESEQVYKNSLNVVDDFALEKCEVVCCVDLDVDFLDMSLRELEKFEKEVLNMSNYIEI